ncbi:MAG: hypothetical protein IKQ92_03490 [Clostridia bacterium]|nr:hypothetical protein [Clostridia bacterium]
MSSIHDRMPVMLRQEMISDWLSPSIDPSRTIRNAVVDPRGVDLRLHRAAHLDDDRIIAQGQKQIDCAIKAVEVVRRGHIDLQSAERAAGQVPEEPPAHAFSVPGVPRVPEQGVRAVCETALTVGINADDALAGIDEIGVFRGLAVCAEKPPRLRGRFPREWGARIRRRGKSRSSRSAAARVSPPAPGPAAGCRGRRRHPRPSPRTYEAMKARNGYLILEF